MVYDLVILNSDAELNRFFEVGSTKFTPGFPVTLNMRIVNPERSLRYVPDSGATFSIEFMNSDGTTFTKVPTVLDSGDRSLVTVSLTDVETADLIGQNIKLTIDEGGVTSLAIAPFGLQAAKSSC